MNLVVTLLCLWMPFASLAQQQPAPAHSRKKRHLTFPQGSNVQLVYCLTIGAYARPGDLVIGLTTALAWELPNKPVLKGLLHRQSRSVLYPKIETFLHSLRLDGRSCVRRALCEAGQRPRAEVATGSFLQELLHAIFTIRNDGTTFESEEHREYDYAHRSRENCADEYPACTRSIFDLDF